ncbi:prolyl oligopeptidase family serine peptidase [bacterium]|nr:prolyl oligopeptidase family serine peptidase [bacterium]
MALPVRIPRFPLALLSFALLALPAIPPPVAAAGDQPEVREIGQLVFDGIPEIPERIVEKTQQYQNVRHATLAGWAPDGGLMISTRFGEVDQIHHVASPGAARRQITFFTEPVRNASFGNEPGWFLFNRDFGGNEASQIFRFDLSSGEATLLSNGEAQNSSPLWSNDRKLIAWRSTARNQRDHDTWVMDPKDPGSARLVFENEGYWVPMDWSPDDLHMLLLNYVSATETYLWIGDVVTGEKKPFGNHDGADGQTIAYGAAAFDKSGDGVYFTSDENSEFSTLRWTNLSSNRVMMITADIPWGVDGIAPSRDRKQLAFTVNNRGSRELYVMDGKTRSYEQIPLPPCYMTGTAWSDDGKSIALSLMTPASPGNAYTVDVKSKEVTPWTESEVGGLDTSTFVMSEIIEFESFDGLTIPSYLYKPKGKGPFPVIIRIHGGPESQALPWFSYTSQYEVNELGCAVMYPNVRGSSGFGKTYVQMDNGFQREDSVKDIGALLDWIAEQPDLDASRVAVTGGSYGGYMSLASLTHYSDRIRCGISSVGISNFVTFLENTSEYRRDLRRVEYGDERDPAMRAHQEKISPTNNVDRINVPLLVVQGANDPRVPASEAEQIVKAVRDKGKEAWFLLAKDEGHGFAKKFNRDQQLYVGTLFWERYLLDKDPEMEMQEKEEVPGASR